MNTRRILLGGMISGVIITVSEALRIATMSADHATGMPVAVLLLRCIMFGVGCVLAYAAMVPRFGSGTKSAAQCGILVFLIAAAFPPLGMTTSAFPTPSLLLVAMIWNAVAIPLATVVGALFYREEEAHLVRPAL